MNNYEEERDAIIDQIIDGLEGLLDNSLKDNHRNFLKKSLNRLWKHGFKRGELSASDDYISIKDQLPEIGKNIIGIDENDNIHYCYLSKFNEWRCSLTGFGLIINIIKWKYEE
jgi:hypothetical protein